MSFAHGNPCSEIERLFHEPNRLAILSALCGATEGLAFVDLKEQCGLTDGNLSRHLKALEEAGTVRIEKSFVGAKPRTTLCLSDKGRTDFLHYLETLEAIVRAAAKKARKAEARAGGPAPANGLRPRPA